MPAKLKPRKLMVVDCSEKCWAHPSKLGDNFDSIHAMYEAADGDDAIVLAVRALGHETSAGAVSRHKMNHLKPWVEPEPEPLDVEDMSDLDILRSIIKRGARFIPTWKLGPRETMQALQMYYQLTQGSAMSDLFASIAAAANKDDDTHEQNIPAALAEGEREQ